MTQKRDDLIQRQEMHLQWVQSLLTSAQNRDWFGTITIEVKRGVIDLVKTEQTFKPPEPLLGDKK